MHYSIITSKQIFFILFATSASETFGNLMFSSEVKKLKPESYLLIEDPDSELVGKGQHHLVGVALDRED